MISYAHASPVANISESKLEQAFVDFMNEKSKGNNSEMNAFKLAVRAFVSNNGVLYPPKS